MEGNADLIAKVKAAQQVAATPSETEAAVLVPLGETSLENFATCKETLERIRCAKLTSDRESLDVLIKEIPQLEVLSDHQRQVLLKLANEARASLAAEKGPADQAAGVLDKLSGPSRQVPRTRPPGSHRLEPPARLDPTVPSEPLYLENLGIQVVPVSRFTGAYGLLVQQVFYWGAGQRIGLEPGDVIVAVNGYRIYSPDEVGYRSGYVVLAIQDVRTGRISSRGVSLYAPPYYSGRPRTR